MKTEPSYNFNTSQILNCSRNCFEPSSKVGGGISWNSHDHWPLLEVFLLPLK